MNSITFFPSINHLLVYLFIYLLTETNGEKQSSPNLPLIIGVSCGSFALLAVVTICLVFHCKRSVPPRSNSHIGDGMPSEEAFPKREKYELQPTNSKEEKLIWIEEKGIWNEGME